MENEKYEYYWNNLKNLFILLIEGIELDEYRTEIGIKKYALLIDNPKNKLLWILKELIK